MARSGTSDFPNTGEQSHSVASAISLSMLHVEGAASAARFLRPDGQNTETIIGLHSQSLEVGLIWRRHSYGGVGCSPRGGGGGGVGDGKDLQ